MIERRSFTVADALVQSERACLQCGYKADRLSEIHEHGEEAARAPSPGDVTMCVRCGNLMAFGDDLGYRPLTDEEMIEIAGEPKLLAMSHGLKYAWEKHGRPQED